MTAAAAMALGVLLCEASAALPSSLLCTAAAVLGCMCTVDVAQWVLHPGQTFTHACN